MSVKPRSGLYQRLRRALSALPTKTVYFVPDSAQWAFFWVAHYLTLGLKERLGVHADMTQSPWELRGQIIHFVDRYAYLNGKSRELHSSNRVFLTWLHGDPSDPNPEMRSLFEALVEEAQRLEKIVVACRMTRQVVGQLGIPASKIETIPLGVDLARFTPAPQDVRLRVRASLGIPDQAICVGSFQKDGVGWGEGVEPKLIKGPDVFLEVMDILSSRYDNLFVVLTGPARGYVKRGLEKLKVRYIHRHLTDYHDIVPYYQALDLYLITSRCEGGPQALLESWATGVPVVSTRVGMAADLMRHGVNGMVADVEDVRMLANHAMGLIEDGALRERCRQQALLDGRDYDWGVIAEQYYQRLYQPCLT